MWPLSARISRPGRAAARCGSLPIRAAGTCRSSILGSVTAQVRVRGEGDGNSQQEGQPDGRSSSAGGKEQEAVHRQGPQQSTHRVRSALQSELPLMHVRIAGGGPCDDERTQGPQPHFETHCTSADSESRRLFEPPPHPALTCGTGNLADSSVQRALPAERYSPASKIIAHLLHSWPGTPGNCREVEGCVPQPSAQLPRSARVQLRPRPSPARTNCPAGTDPSRPPGPLGVGSRSGAGSSRGSCTTRSGSSPLPCPFWR